MVLQVTVTWLPPELPNGDVSLYKVTIVQHIY
jgi:hypothetical protein